MERPKEIQEPFDRKLLRLNNRMNKIKAFLQLTQKGKNSSSFLLHDQQAEESPDSGIEVEFKPVLPADELQHLRARLRAQQKEKMSRPLLFQTSEQKAMQGLHISEIRQLFMYALEGGNAQGIKPGWCQLERWQKVSQIIVVCVENMSKVDFDAYCARSSSMGEFLTVSGCFLLQNTDPLSRNLLEYQVSARRLARLGKFTSKNDVLIQAYKSYSDIPRPLLTFSSNLSPSCRLSLLMSVERMILEKYPFPGSGAEISHYIRTKENYASLHPESPLFAVDCEMCMTSTNRHELTRISIVNEKLQVVYDTYVKPYNPVINYLTRYSGITKSILDSVKTRLHDVQAAVRKLLPPDAILCGQSLNGDLDAMEMMHPYVIDTSVIYNLTGNPRGKSSLKLLSQVLLSKNIQSCDRKGHDSVEDSRTTMELVLLKQKHGLSFGDVTSGWRMCPEEMAPHERVSSSADNMEQIMGVTQVSQPEPAISFPIKRKHMESDGFAQEFTPDTPKTSCHFNQSLLKCAADMKKPYFVVGSSDYIQRLAEKEATVYAVRSAKKALKAATENISCQFFVFCEIVLKCDGSEEKKQARIDSAMKRIWRLFSTAADRSLCALVLSGDSTVIPQQIGVCYANVKNSVSMRSFSPQQSSITTDLD